MVAELALSFPSGSLDLSGLLAIPPGATRACVLCHPHPLYGGNMHNPVVVAMADQLSAAGVATLRFDFRGVGHSGGAHSGGDAEVDDARAAVDALSSRSGLARVAVAGYSFGARIALRLAAGDSRIGAVAAIAPPLEMFDLAFTAGISAPLLAVAGDRDPYCPTAVLRAWVDGLQRAHGVVIDGADHFFAGRERQVADEVVAFLTAV